MVARTDVQLTAVERGALAHPDQPVTRAVAVAVGRAGAGAVVGDRELERLGPVAGGLFRVRAELPIPRASYPQVSTAR